MPLRQSVRQASTHLLFLANIVTVSAVGCSAAPGALVTGDDWSRSYVLPYDRVWTAAVASLSSSGYFLDEEDRGQGRIRAEEAGEPAYRAVVLAVRVNQHGEEVRVYVQASGGGVGAPGEIGHLDHAATEFLDELDNRLGQR